MWQGVRGTLSVGLVLTSAAAGVVGGPAAAQAGESTATISGAVVNELGDPLWLTCVSVYDGDQVEIQNLLTDQAGHYETAGLQPGSYSLEFNDCLGDGAEYGYEFYDERSTLTSADPVTVSAGERLENVDAALPKAGVIQGTATDSDGNPIQDACVDVFTADGVDNVGGARTGAAGNYRITGLRTYGNYLVKFVQCSNETNFIGEYYDGQSTLATATPVAVTAGEITPNIDAELAEAGVITGTVLDQAGDPFEGLLVQLTGPAPSFDSPAFDIVGPDGHYRVFGLVPGSYVVHFYDGFGNAPAFPEWYDDAQSFASADPVTVGSSEIVEGIDATVLRPGLEGTPPPETFINGGPRQGETLGTGKVRIELGGTPGDVDHYECKLDGGSFEECGMTVNLDLEDGHHAFAARSVDFAGQADQTPAHVEFDVVRAKFFAPQRQLFSKKHAAIEATIRCKLGCQATLSGRIAVKGRHRQSRLRARSVRAAPRDPVTVLLEPKRARAVHLVRAAGRATGTIVVKVHVPGEPADHVYRRRVVLRG